MGKKGKWFVAVKKAFSPDSKQKKDTSSDSQRKWESRSPLENLNPTTSSSENVALEPPLSPREVVEGMKGGYEECENAEANAAPIPVEISVTSREAISSSILASGTTREEKAATKIQTAFRGFLARKELRSLKGLDRLKSLIHGPAVKRQAATTLRCMQTLTKVQTQIHTRRMRMSEENRALQRQIQHKREKDLENLSASMGGEWDDSSQSKEKVEANLLSKQEAAVRRERALAYAFSHQLRKISRSTNPMFTDVNNPQWGWSWLERWMASRPWDDKTLSEKDLNDPKTYAKSVNPNGVMINKVSTRHEEPNTDRQSPIAQKSRNILDHQSPSSPLSTQTPLRKMITVSPNIGGKSGIVENDSSNATLSSQSEKSTRRRHSLPGSSSPRADLNSMNSSILRSYMIPTESAKAKSRLQSASSSTLSKPEFPDKSSNLTKKGPSFKGSPTTRRHSFPSKVDIMMEDISNNGGDSLSAEEPHKV